MTLRHKSQAGFTLLELMIAVLVLAIGLLGLAELQITAIRTNSSTATLTAANALAQRVVEEVAAMDPADVMFNAPGTGTWSSAVTPSPITIEGAGTYNITYTVSRVIANGTPVTNLFRVAINVSSTNQMMGASGLATRTAIASTLKRAI